MTHTAIRPDHRNHEEPLMTIPGIERNNGHTATPTSAHVDQAAPGHMLRRIDDLEARVKALTARVTTLEAGTTRGPDDLNQQIMELLRQHPGLKFTPYTVAGNIGQTNSSVSKRLRRMVEQGLIAAEGEEGRTRTYYLPSDDQ